MKKCSFDLFCNKECNKYKKLYLQLENEKIKKKFIMFIVLLNYDIFKKIIYLIFKDNWHIFKKEIDTTKKKIKCILSDKKKYNIFFKKIMMDCYSVLNKINTYQNLFDIFYQYINNPNLLKIIKICLFIIKDYKLCKFLSKFDKNNIKKKDLNFLIKVCKNNINYLNIFINNILPTTITNWGNKNYSTSRSMYLTLQLLSKYYKNPLKKLNIQIILGKKNNTKKSIESFKKICKKYKIVIKKNDKFLTLNNCLIFLKKLGINMWNSVDILIRSIYPKFKLTNVEKDFTFTCNESYNNITGIKCFILTKNGFITNANIFRRFKHSNYLN